MSGRRLTLVAAAVSVGTFALFLHPPTAPGDPGSWCRQAENGDYPQLEAAVDEVLGDLPDRVARISECEERGQPEASVSASVYRWTTKKEASDYLRSRGLARESGASRFQSPDGACEVVPSVVGDHLENQGRTFVSLRFSLPR
jgi:hypothetical protein